MAYKKSSGMDLGTLLLYGVGAYFVYTNWSSISAWFANVSAGAAPAASPTLAPSPISSTPVSPSQVAVAPSSAGTLVPLGPSASVPQPVTTLAPTASQQGPGLTVNTPPPPNNPLPPALTLPPGSELRLMRPIAPIVVRGPLVLPATPHYRTY